MEVITTMINPQILQKIDRYNLAAAPVIDKGKVIFLQFLPMRLDETIETAVRRELSAHLTNYINGEYDRTHQIIMNE